MSTASAARSAVSPTVEVDDDAVEQRVVVYDCTRIGLTANPPGFSFADFFRFGRRRP
ncbi:hypothetical protein [Mycolicibacterium sp. 050158]|jgi:hypothetical protein|uniref:hypothetical protein n=1 Tax=Mycolicibacterium sp. 050158 TaxID=3090602 RepID=UPI00299DE62E|nr:hypothetical protein [Mycolicibacterium sp. 050158]MDX1891488.1 hypothetical protein [Mycolicibacterium sp. 050158]